jgi:hypothetical protein
VLLHFGDIYWRSVDLRKSFVLIYMKALWFIMRINQVSDGRVVCIRIICDGIKACVKCGGDEVLDFVGKKKSVWWG